MPGLRASYNAINADCEFRYSDEHEFCMARAYWPAGAISGVYVFFGTLAAQPTIWDTDYDPDRDEDAAAFLTAGIAYVRVDVPIDPQTSVDSRHAFRRLPDNWKIAGRVIQYMKTHALDGLLSAMPLPTDARGYIAAGSSGGAHTAAMLAFAPDGALPYDVTAPWNMSNWTMRFSHRVAGCALSDFATADFRLFAGGVSAAAVPFFGVGERFYPGTIADIKRLDVVSQADKLACSVMPSVEADYEENRHISVFINSAAASMEEASYRGSGVTFNYTSLASGTSTGATRIQDNATGLKFATIKLIQVGYDGTTYVYAEPDSATSVSDFTGQLDFVNAASTVIGTVTAYTASGQDTQKTFVTKLASLAAIDAAAGEPLTEFNTPHRVEFSALMQRARNAIRDRHGLASVWKDQYYIGSAYPAQLSGDTPAYPYNNDEDLTTKTVAWVQDVIAT